MGKRVNFCKDCKFCYHHKREFTGWDYYCTNPKVTLCNFIHGREEYVLCGAVRRIDTNRIVEFWKEFRAAKGNVGELIEKYKDSNKKLQCCPLYRKKLTLGRFFEVDVFKINQIWKEIIVRIVSGVIRMNMEEI